MELEPGAVRGLLLLLLVVLLCGVAELLMLLEAMGFWDASGEASRIAELMVCVGDDALWQ